MRVLHIINSLDTGGAEKLLLDSLPLYEQYNINVELFLLNAKETPFLNELKQKFKGNIYKSAIKNIYSPMQIFEIKKHFKNQYDIIHVHLFPALYWVSLLRLFLHTKEKLVFTEHSTNNKRLRNFFFRQVDKFIYGQYEKITAITPQVKTVLVDKLKLSPQKIVVVYNGIDVHKYKVAQAYSKTDFFDEKKTILIQVSRFQEQKDQKTVIKALKLLPEQYTLLLVGDGELRIECEKLVTDLDLKERVKFLGVRMDIPELMKTSDIVIQSSHWEGFGLTAVEGMAAGKPVIASNVSGLTDIVKDTGLIFEKGNEIELSNKILQLRDNEFYKSISDRCEGKAKLFDVQYMVREMINTYNKLLG